MGVENDAVSIAIAGAREGSRIVYLEEDEGIWKCRHCSWTYGLLGSGAEPFQKHKTSCQLVMESRTIIQTQDDDFNKPMVIVEPSSSERISQKDHISSASALPTTIIIPQGDVQIQARKRSFVEIRRENEWEVLKSIVYGGLIESIISLGVVSSAAGANTSTLNVVSLGLANLIGGFLVMLHDLSEIRSGGARNQNNDQSDQYYKLLGRRANFKFHVAVSLISYSLFGLLPPLIYGFSSKDSTAKLILVAATSLLFSGLSYVGGVLISRFMEQIGLLEPEAPLPPSLELFGAGSGLVSW
ncbi:membrane protein of ER body-like protein isoform X2 [Phalaenopsis equestris]|uniref:membrane protein of ER body-like protein isoform X2 n=1 Tax=Phalaenopsis equestris TaxID=78828 RepID=UPI0009E21624|nr:membrane protein of ER body-like protein isoform X2 [Phalaenopsis equestris]